MDEPSLEAVVAANLAAIRARVAAAARRAGRDPGDVRLVAVSKTFGPEAVRAAAAAGQVDFGENRVQEALQKIAATAELQIRWHLIGHLQSNKARRAAGAFASIQSVDSLDLLRRLEAGAAGAGRQVSVLLQVDLAGEATKFGAPPAEVTRMLEAAQAHRHAVVEGLMLLPPLFEEAEQSRPYFRRLRRWRDEWLAAGVPPAMLRHLSMGMSHDFEVAIEEGATIVRIGTAVFGARTVRQAGDTSTSGVGDAAPGARS
jgi:hypothetical protein